MLRRPALHRLVAVAVVVALTALTGCDTDVSQDDDRDPTADVVREGLVGLYAGDATGPDVEGEAGCFADALLDRVTPEDLVVAEVVEDKGRVADAVPMLDVDLAGAWADAVLGCADYGALAARQAQRTAEVDPAAYAACVDAAVPEPTVREALVADLTGTYDSRPVTLLSEAERRCD